MIQPKQLSVKTRIVLCVNLKKSLADLKPWTNLTTLLKSCEITFLAHKKYFWKLIRFTIKTNEKRLSTSFWWNFAKKITAKVNC